MSFINTRSVTEGEESPIRGNVDSALHQTNGVISCIVRAWVLATIALRVDIVDELATEF
jgi:hypothetical protein